MIDRTGIPAHTVQFGAKGCVTWSHDAASATTATTRPRTSSWRSRSGSTASTAACCCRPGLDEQWLISVMHDEADAMRYADVFAEFVDELVA